LLTSNKFVFGKYYFQAKAKQTRTQVNTSHSCGC